uniref:Ser-Thr-rich glycosyl-phosphatidyl-inositol-anchored membrane family protein n=1 Tax=Schlesneria paludicola TaxID=360056 RepID=A0A7C2JYP2_9PLAN
MLTRWMALALTACGLALSAAPLEAATKPVVTNKLRFRIPFRFDAATLQRMNARELQLFVSQNRGVNWELAQTIAPQAGRFEFQAPADGEYWFAVRTVDGFGQVHPAGQTMEAGLIVIVDTLPPSLALNLEQMPDGKIELTWSASDVNLDQASLQLESQQPGQAGWQTVSVIPNSRGMTSWSIPAAGLVSIRGSISDLAGNRGQAQTQLQVTGGRGPAPREPAIRQPIAGGLPDGALPAESAPLTSEPQLGSLPISPGPSTANIGPTIILPQPAPSQQFISDSPVTRPEITQDRWTPGSEGMQPVPYRGNSRQKVVNTLKFQLGYKVDDVGPSGVGGVELFITQDGGRQWFRYGEDADRTSPFEVTVPRDGEYGFTVRVRSGAGLGQEPPQPGEPPSIVVIVDQTPPLLELFPVQQGRGAELNQILIRWKITEARPSEKPVSLYYAATPAGPWEPISGWRPDTGTFTWTAGPGAPSQFYIRIVARDAAGNTATAETPQPIVVDLSRPSARIVDVEVEGVPR